MTSDPISDHRDPLLEYLSNQLLGPMGDESETILGLPNKRYVVGILYPRDSLNNDERELTEESSANTRQAMEEASDDPVSLSYQRQPSACGLSLFLEPKATLTISIQTGRYKHDGSGNWVRNPVPGAGITEDVQVKAPRVNKRFRETHQILGGFGQLDVIWRPLSGGLLVTVSLSNSQIATGDPTQDAENCLYQVSLRIVSDNGKIIEYPTPEFSSIDEEDQELQLLHRNKRSFAIGHGCSTNWLEGKHLEAEFVEISFLPTHTLPGMSVSSEGSAGDLLRLEWLSDPDTSDDAIIESMNVFISEYEGWLDRLPGKNQDISRHLWESRDRLLSRIKDTIYSMKSGVQSLGKSKEAFTAFRHANRAMLTVMQHSRPNETEHTWRPFQIAYQLSTLASLIDETSPDRETVDLLWVPTGGGKTEAYLMLTAFEIFRRRLVHGVKGTGTAVITRYTLRLLTAQQFQRAALLMCACETIRRDSTDLFGDSPITIGLWVGQSASPNTYRAANSLYNDMLAQQEPVNPFPIRECPWCETTLVPDWQTDDHEEYGFRSNNNSFSIFCPKIDCEFHDRLPIGIIDQDLYDHPPTVLIATVDKFARLAWEERGGVFFGAVDRLPPTLVIQDELHLISGPLGTATGLYETAITMLLKLRNSTPKVLASTATIRRADLQIKGIFGKTVRLFPPSGLDADNSYFVRADHEITRNKYVGVMSSNHTKDTTLIRISASLLQGWHDLRDTLSAIHPDVVDAFSSLIVYHNSLSELGQSSKFAHDDIAAWMSQIAPTDDGVRDIQHSDILELTSTLNAIDLPESLNQLSIPHDEPGTLKIVLCTNMFSVGVDETRLGLMLIHGQPKTTSEYIQSTGRIGRGSVPGLVVTHYSSQKSRDRSHYESFKKYHSALYSYVEPGSVTPFSRPARERGLHAVLVILTRHWLNLSSNTDASRFRKDTPGLNEVIDMLVGIAKLVDPVESNSTRQHLEELVDQWDQAARDSEGSLVYSGRALGQDPLLTIYGSDSGLWPTLNSMRNVDRECVLRVGSDA